MKCNLIKRNIFFMINFFDCAGELVLAHIRPDEVFKI